MLRQTSKYFRPGKYLNYVLRKLCEFKAGLKLPDQVDEVRERWKTAGNEEMSRLRSKTLEFVDHSHRVEEGIGAYAFKPGGPRLLYASCYAALILHLYGKLQKVSEASRKEWVRYLNSFQGDDGIYRDAKVACPAAEELDWWGWRHLTLHVIMALQALGGVAKRPFTVVDFFKQKGAMTRWLEERSWHKDAAVVGNQVQNYATMLQYARDYHEETWCQDALEEMYSWLDCRQDPETGLWGPRFDTPFWVSQGVQTGYHLWMLYFYDCKNVQYPERIIDSCLATQNKLGGFGVALNSSACEDIDSIDPLVRLGRGYGHRKNEVLPALERSLYWVLANFTEEGGAVFRRHEALMYGHELMSARREEASLFPTWFRTLTLGYLGQALPNTAVGRYPWRFLAGPGHQHYLTKPAAG